MKDGKKKKILVTGGGGFIGSFVVQKLATIGEVTILEHPASMVSASNLIRADITNSDQVKKALAGFDVVVHLVAVFNTEKFQPTHEQMFDVNMTGTVNLLEACATNGIKKFVMASSICAFGTIPESLPVREEHPAKPGGAGSHMYGISKFVGENLCQGYTNLYGIDTVCLRLAVVKDLINIGVGLPPSVGTLWSYVDVRDVAQAFALTIKSSCPGHEVFFISAADTLSDISNTKMIQREMPWIRNTQIDSVWMEQPFASFYSINKARKMLGYTPKYSWRK